METDLGWSRVEITGAFSVGMGVAALAALPGGRCIGPRGARARVAGGSCLGTALLLVWSRVESLPALYAVWCLMGLALAATLYEPAFAAVVGWFATRGRDKALLTVTLAGALASTIFMPLEAWLVGRLGWRGALVALAVTLAVITIPLHALLLRPAPRRAPPTPGDERREARVPGLTLGASVPMAVMLGAANGMATLARATTIAEIFGPRHYGSISGAIALGANGARALAPVGAALLMVALGGYERVFWLLATSLVVAGLGVIVTRPGGDGSEMR